jgi:lipoate-protein ligase B
MKKALVVIAFVVVSVVFVVIGFMRKGKTANTVLFVEHPPVITLGARQSANRLVK